MKAIRKGDDTDLAAAAHVDLELVPGESNVSEDMMREEQTKLKRAAVIVRSMTVFMTLALIILWPMPMYGSGYVFSEVGASPILDLFRNYQQLTTKQKFFTGWVMVGILWLFISSFCVGLFPLWERRHSMAHTFKSMYLDIIGKRKPTLQGREGAVTEESPGSSTPDEKVTDEVAAKEE